MLYNNRGYKQSTSSSSPYNFRKTSKPVRTSKDLYPYSSSTNDTLVNTFKPKSYYDSYKIKWEWRRCNRKNGHADSYWLNCYKLRAECDIDEPHWKKWKKTLTKKTIPKWKDCRAKEEMDNGVYGIGYDSPKTVKKNDVSFRWETWYYSGRNTKAWHPISEDYWSVGHRKKILQIKCNKWSKLGQKISDLVGHTCKR